MQGQFPGMKEQPRSLVSHCRWSVKLITDDRMTDGLQVNPQLV